MNRHTLGLSHFHRTSHDALLVKQSHPPTSLTRYDWAAVTEIPSSGGDGGRDTGSYVLGDQIALFDGTDVSGDTPHIVISRRDTNTIRETTFTVASPDLDSLCLLRSRAKQTAAHSRHERTSSRDQTMFESLSRDPRAPHFGS